MLVVLCDQRAVSFDLVRGLDPVELVIVGTGLHSAACLPCSTRRRLGFEPTARPTSSGKLDWGASWVGPGSTTRRTYR